MVFSNSAGCHWSVVAAEEPVEVLEAQAPGPLVEGPARALHPLRNQVVLAEPRRVVAVVDENVADGADALGDDRGVARIARGELRDVGHAARVVIAAGQQRGPRRRAERGGVKMVVAETAFAPRDRSSASGSGRRRCWPRRSRCRRS